MEKIKLDDGRITLIRGDCLEVMPKMKSGIIDLILADLPYGTTACKWDSIIPFDKLWDNYKRLVFNDSAIVLFGTQPFTSTLISSNLTMYRYSWIWDKAKSTNFMSAKLMPLLKTEDICVFSHSTCNSMSLHKMRYFPQGTIHVDKIVKNGKNVGGKVAKDRNAIFLANKEYRQSHTNYPKNILEFPNDNNPLHPTQKPVALMEYLIKTYTNENDLVLDNTMGSGTTAVACINTNRRFVGIEKDTDDKGNSLGYFDICIKRCEEALAERDKQKAA